MNYQTLVFIHNFQFMKIYNFYIKQFFQYTISKENDAAMKINKQKPYLTGRQEAGGESFYICVTQNTLLTSTRRSLPCISCRKWCYFTT